MLKTYNSCTFCNSKKLKKEKKQILSKNFYIKAIISDLNLTEEKFNKIKVFKCLKCNNLQNSPWFDEHTVKKIYSNIYGQHNKSWTNLINFSRNKKKFPHGQLFKFLK
jgi:DNA-directed RNA polymerase subunit RPC12/RpoP